MLLSPNAVAKRLSSARSQSSSRLAATAKASARQRMLSAHVRRPSRLRKSSSSVQTHCLIYCRQASVLHQYMLQILDPVAGPRASAKHVTYLAIIIALIFLSYRVTCMCYSLQNPKLYSYLRFCSVIHAHALKQDYYWLETADCYCVNLAGHLCLPGTCGQEPSAFW